MEHFPLNFHLEFECDLPLGLYNDLALDGLPSISKVRHYWNGEDGLLWEVDEFEGPISGLIIAEVELEDESQKGSSYETCWAPCGE